jgi:hypothetical protein
MVTVVIIAIVVALLFLLPGTREWIVEGVKACSDFLVLTLLRRTSRFGVELTKDGHAEQKLWREQQLRNLRGLALRSKEAISAPPSGSGNNRTHRDNRE